MHCIIDMIDLSIEQYRGKLDIIYSGYAINSYLACDYDILIVKVAV